MGYNDPATKHDLEMLESSIMREVDSKFRDADGKRFERNTNIAFLIFTHLAAGFFGLGIGAAVARAG